MRPQKGCKQAPAVCLVFAMAGRAVARTAWPSRKAECGPVGAVSRCTGPLPAPQGPSGPRLTLRAGARQDRPAPRAVLGPPARGRAAAGRRRAALRARPPGARRACGRPLAPQLRCLGAWARRERWLGPGRAASCRRPVHREAKRVACQSSRGFLVQGRTPPDLLSAASERVAGA